MGMVFSYLQFISKGRMCNYYIGLDRNYWMVFRYSRDRAGQLVDKEGLEIMLGQREIVRGTFVGILGGSKEGRDGYVKVVGVGFRYFGLLYIQIRRVRYCYVYFFIVFLIGFLGFFLNSRKIFLFLGFSVFLKINYFSRVWVLCLFQLIFIGMLNFYFGERIVLVFDFILRFLVQTFFRNNI